MIINPNYYKFTYLVNTEIRIKEKKIFITTKFSYIRSDPRPLSKLLRLSNHLVRPV